MSNWYRNLKTASFIDTIGCESYSDSHAVLIVGGKKYLYSGLDGYAVNNTITRLRSMPNKQEAGRQASLYLAKIKGYLQRENDEESIQSLIDRSEQVG
jgi:hypothetical protein